MAGPAIGNDVGAQIVLVVEDEFFIAMEIEDILVEEGFRVLGPAGTLQDALEMLEQETPSLAVLDVNLGGERVTPVALRLRSLGTPFVLATASDVSELASEPVLAEAINVGKPFDRRTLVDALRRASGEPATIDTCSTS